MEQDQIVIIAVIAIALIAAALIWMAMRRRHTDALKQKFGDEYDRTVEQVGNRPKAEAALAEREKRVSTLDIKPLTPQQRGDFAKEWREVKAVFVDSPVEAVHHADRLLSNIMRTRGYPMADFERRYEDLTVDHGEVARHYREGHEITLRHEKGNASTEELRQAMIHFEALFDDLVNEVTDEPDTRTAKAPEQTRQ